MFKGTLDQLVTNADEQNVLWRSLLQAIHDHGGNGHHLDRLLSNTKDSRSTLNAVARGLIKPWQYVETKTDLGTIDFECSAEMFCTQYRQVEDIRPGQRTGDGCWTETRPTMPCHYRLEHINKPLTYDQIMELGSEKGGPLEYAGWRELVAFVACLPPGTLRGGNCIIAPGSELGNGLDPKYQSECFPIAQEFSMGSTSIAWKGLDRKHEQRFGLETFLLIRVSYSN